MDLNRWWQDDPDERFWLEVTDRTDVGANLHAPQTDVAGRESWTYSLVCEVDDGDVVFHYELDERAITGWSIAVGGWWEDELTWAAHGTVGRNRAPSSGPSFCRGLQGPFEISQPLSLHDFRYAERQLAELVNGIKAEHEGSLYLPFQFRRDELRMGQGYLFKLPVAILSAFPQLAEVAEVDSTPPASRPRRDRSGGRPYRRADEHGAISERDPFPVDPSVVERGVQSHARLQNRLADHVEALGYEPQSPDAGDPQYDLRWQGENAVCIAEIKSLTDRNEERQLRLGLGQLLRYRHGLRAAGKEVHAYLVCERKPRDERWIELCAELNIELVWPTTLSVRVR